MVLKKKKIEEIFQRQGQNFLYGESTSDYDHNTEIYFNTFNQITFSDFVLNVRSAHNIFRHPVSGLTWYTLWNATKSYLHLKYILLMVFVLNALLLYSLIKKIVNSDYIAFLSLVFFIISPLTYSHAASHDWTLAMSKSQIGLFFLYSSLLLFLRFLKKPNIIFLLFSLFSFCFAVMSWEVFIGFILCFPIINLFNKNLKIKKNTNEEKKIKIHFIIFYILLFLSPIYIKIFVNYLINFFDYKYLLPKENFVDLYPFYRNWIIGIFGIDTSQFFSTKAINETMVIYSNEKFILLKKIIFNLFYFTDKYNWLNQLIRLHFTSPLYYFNHSMIYLWVAIFYFISFSILNILIVYPQQYFSNIKNYNLKFTFILGFFIFIASIITALISNGNIYIRYIYTGYSGLILMLLTLMIFLNKVFPNKDHAIIVNITLLTLCEISILERIFPAELA